MAAQLRLCQLRWVPAYCPAQAIRNFDGGVVLVSHDFRLIDQACPHVRMHIRTCIGAAYEHASPHALMCNRVHPRLHVCLPGGQGDLGVRE